MLMFRCPWVTSKKFLIVFLSLLIDHVPHSIVSDLGLHCLSNSLLDIRYQVKKGKKNIEYTCPKQPLKIDKTKFLMTNDSLMKVKSIAECSKGRSILQYF